MATVTVSAPFLVFWEGQQHGAGTVLSVPEELAHTWLREGWATIKPATRRKRPDPA